MKKPLRITVLIVLLPFACFQSASLAANPVRVLSDYELDQICAGGLNLDFDSLLGSRATTTDTVSKGGVSDSTAGMNQSLVFNNNGGKVQIVTN